MDKDTAIMIADTLVSESKLLKSHYPESRGWKIYAMMTMDIRRAMDEVTDVQTPEFILSCMRRTVCMNRLSNCITRAEAVWKMKAIHDMEIYIDLYESED